MTAAVDAVGAEIRPAVTVAVVCATNGSVGIVGAAGAMVPPVGALGAETMLAVNVDAESGIGARVMQKGMNKFMFEPVSTLPAEGSCPEIVICGMFVVFSVIGEASSIVLVSHSGEAVALDELDSGDGSPFIVLKYVVSNHSGPAIHEQWINGEGYLSIIHFRFLGLPRALLRLALRRNHTHIEAVVHVLLFDCDSRPMPVSIPLYKEATHFPIICAQCKLWEDIMHLGITCTMKFHVALQPTMS
jgi:hypothetical protein